MVENYYTNKIVWITGASSGIGKETAIQLASKGAKLVLSARNSSELEILRKSLKNSTFHLVLPLDLEKSANFDELTSLVIEKFGRIDILVNNGGISQRATAFETTMEVNRKIMEINFFGNIALAKSVLPYMQAQKSGQFLIISSISGKFGFFLRSAYCASKHALHGYYDSLSLEEEQNGIKVTMVCPGKINTPISTNAIGGHGENHGLMDHNQATGMPVSECVKKMLVGLKKQKRELLIGNKEILAVRIKRFFPNLFWKIIKKQAAT